MHRKKYFVVHSAGPQGLETFSFSEKIGRTFRFSERDAGPQGRVCSTMNMNCMHVRSKPQGIQHNSPVFALAHQSKAKRSVVLGNIWRKQ